MLSNKRLKEIKKLTLKKYRNNSAEILVEGKRIIQQIISYGIYPSTIFIDESNSEAKNVIEKSKRDIIEYIPSHAIKQITETKTPQDVVGLFYKPCLPMPTQGNFLYLDDLKDPGNVGTIFRTAIALNIDGIFISPDSCEVFSPKVIRSSLGGIFKLPFAIKNLSDIHFSDCDIFATELNGIPLTEITEFQKNSLIIIGNEAHGISPSNLDLANKKITIPMTNNMESLNASVATGITIFHLMWKKYGNQFTNR